MNIKLMRAMDPEYWAKKDRAHLPSLEGRPREDNTPWRARRSDQAAYVAEIRLRQPSAFLD